MILAKETTQGAMYRLTKLTDVGKLAWYTRTKMPAGEYIRKLRNRMSACNGREIYMINLFKANPDAVLFIRRNRGEDSLSGKFEQADKVLLPGDTELREVKQRPGFKKQENSERKRPVQLVPPGTYLEPMGSNVTYLTDTEETGSDKSDALSGLTRDRLEVEDALEEAISQAMEGVSED